MREWIGYVLAVIFLSTTISVYLVMDDKIEKIYAGTAIDAIQTSIEASDNLYTVYQFAQYEHTEGIIDSVKYGESIQKIVTTHDKLIELVKRKSQGESTVGLTDMSVKMLEARREAYVNLKSAIDLSADNFNEVAANKFSEAEEIKGKIQQQIQPVK